MIRLVQLRHPSHARRVALVDEPHLILLNVASVYELAHAALAANASLSESAHSRNTGEKLSYDAIYSAAASGLDADDWTLLPSFDHPVEPARCLVTGTGLTHQASADRRDAMHEAGAKLTDSMAMYGLGVEGGRPAPGEIGVAPEWFYKGCGTNVRAHGEPLEMPAFAEDGGEEPEIAGVYIIDDSGNPRRIGMTIANEFSDHRLESRNYLYLQHSKLRNCAIGPELVVDPEFGTVPGEAAIERGGSRIWSKPIASGEARMCHSLANVEHHHFKYDAHRRPGDAHIHFFGADAFSFSDGVRLQNGDVMSIAFEGFGRPLRNPVRVDRGQPKLIEVRAI